MRIIPPVVAALYLGAGWAVEKLLPNEPLIPRGVPAILAGAACLLAGMSLGLWALRCFHSHHTTHDPYGTPAELVTDGPYAFTRNPMYTGLTLGLLGVGILAGSAAMLAVPVAFLYTANKFFVPREEKVLAELFELEFEIYRANVRRWI